MSLKKRGTTISELLDQRFFFIFNFIVKKGKLINICAQSLLFIDNLNNYDRIILLF